MATPCLDEITIASLVDGTIDDASRATAMRHLGVCAACREQLADVSDALRDPAIARALSAGSSVPSRRKAPARVALIGSIAAALVLATVGRPWHRSDPSPTLRDERNALGTAPAPLAPRGTVRAVDRFAWSRVQRADRYRITVFGADGTVVWEAETPDTTIAPASPSRLRAQTQYLWRVEARTEFERWAGSRLTSFEVDPSRSSRGASR